MLEKIKETVKENPETTKKVALVGGAVLGAAVVGTVLYLNRGNLEMPFGIEDIPMPEVPAE